MIYRRGFWRFGPSSRLTLPLAGLAPGPGLEDLTTRTRRPLPLGRFGLRTLPSLQLTAFSAAFARASVLPASFGTRHAGGVAFRRVYEIGAEQAEVFPAASVAVAEKEAVAPSATATAMPGEPSSAALPVAIGVPAQPGPE